LPSVQVRRILQARANDLDRRAGRGSTVDSDEGRVIGPVATGIANNGNGDKGISPPN